MPREHGMSPTRGCILCPVLPRNLVARTSAEEEDRLRTDFVFTHQYSKNMISDYATYFPWIRPKT
jgi:hypothetical protein